MGVFTDAIAGSRWVVVVRRGDESTYEYLRSRLARVRGVDVTLDRRWTTRERGVAGDRRREPTSFNAFGVLLARR